MRLENSFEVPVDPEKVWAYLVDVERVVVCMPGAELTQTVDERNFKGRVAIKLGPVSLQFAGNVTVAERDDGARRVVLVGSGMEQRGQGRAAVKVTTTVHATEGGSRVDVTQDLQVQGQVASMSRGMMGDVTARLTRQFAECLEANLRAGEEARGRASAPAADGKSEGTTGAAVAAAPQEVAGAKATTPGEVFPESTQQPTGSAPVPSTPGAPPGPPTTAAGAPVKAPEIRVLSLLAGALWDRLKALFGRLFRRGRSPDR